MGIVKGVVQGVQTASNMYDQYQNIQQGTRAPPSESQSKLAPVQKVKAPKEARIGPMLPSGKFHTPEAKAHKKAKKAKKAAKRGQ